MSELSEFDIAEYLLKHKEIFLARVETLRRPPLCMKLMLRERFEGALHTAVAELLSYQTNISIEAAECAIDIELLKKLWGNNFYTY